MNDKHWAAWFAFWVGMFSNDYLYMFGPLRPLQVNLYLAIHIGAFIVAIVLTISHLRGEE